MLGLRISRAFFFIFGRMRSRCPWGRHLQHFHRIASKQDFSIFLTSTSQHSTTTTTRKHHLVANLLQSLTTENNPISNCKQIHAHNIVSGFESNAYLNNLLLTVYSKSGFLWDARKLFDKMPRKSSVSWSSMVSIYTQHGFCEEAVLVFLEFRRCRNQDSNDYILASVLGACSQMGCGGGCVSIGRQVHGFVIKVGFDQNVYVGTSLVDFYVKRGEIDEAEMVFDGLRDKSLVTWTTMITGFVKEGRSEMSLQLLNQMRETNIVPDRYVLCSVLSACTALEFVEGGKQIHGYVLRRETQMDVSVGNVLVNLYAKCGKVQAARNMLDSMSDRNVISWTTMIAGYMQNCFDEEAVELFVQMTRMGWKPDGFVCASILTSCGSLEALKQGRQVHAYSIKANLEYDPFVLNGMIDMYAKCGSLIDARRVFDTMAGRNVVSYNSMIQGYSSHEQLPEALKLFHEMRLRMILPNLLTFVSLLGVSAALSALELSRQIHAFITKHGVSLEVFAGSALIDVYSKCSCITDARLVFDKMNEKDTVVWNAMLFGYARQSRNEEALKLYSDLQLSEQKPNVFTFVALIAAASNLANMRHGQQFHGHVIKMGLDLDPIVLNSLIDMYAKCGNFKDACKTFDFAIWRDIACWNSMITTYAHHGEAREALQMFERMIQEGIKPNYVSFVGVLSACNHAGLVDAGLCHFESMLKFGVEPGIEHCTCMVSLLGRAGKLYEAKEFIIKMPIKPTAAVWRSLLSACVISGNVELGKYAAEMAISIDPTDSGSYTLLASIFASKGMWIDAKGVRERMDFSRAVKERGRSLIGSE